jgi:hypothetical protein
MALSTYLDLVNDVLVRMREPEVSSVNENTLSKLIGKFINDAKRQVEDSYPWSALRRNITVTTSNGVSSYTLTGSNVRSKPEYVWNNTTKRYMEYRSAYDLNEWLNSDNPEVGEPYYYNFNGVSSNGEIKVDLYQIPDKAYTLRFNMSVPQNDLINPSDELLVPIEPVTHLAFAKALVERGEDGALQSSEAYALFKQVLADYVAIESGRRMEEEIWRTV